MVPILRCYCSYALIMGDTDLTYNGLSDRASDRNYAIQASVTGT